MLGFALALRDIRRFDRLLRLVLTEGERVPELRDAISTALRGPGEQLSWDEAPMVVVALAALGGYHLFSLVQGRAFQGVAEDDFLAELARLVDVAEQDVDARAQAGQRTSTPVATISLWRNSHTSPRRLTVADASATRKVKSPGSTTKRICGS